MATLTVAPGPRAPSCIPGRGRRRGARLCRAEDAFLDTRGRARYPWSQVGRVAAPLREDGEAAGLLGFLRQTRATFPARTGRQLIGPIVTVSRLYWFFCRLHEFLRTTLVPVGAAPGTYGIVRVSQGPAGGRIKNLWICKTSCNLEAAHGLRARKRLLFPHRGHQVALGTNQNTTLPPHRGRQALTRGLQPGPAHVVRQGTAAAVPVAGHPVGGGPAGGRGCCVRVPGWRSRAGR